MSNLYRLYVNLGLTEPEKSTVEMFDCDFTGFKDASNRIESVYEHFVETNYPDQEYKVLSNKEFDFNQVKYGKDFLNGVIFKRKEKAIKTLVYLKNVDVGRITNSYHLVLIGKIDLLEIPCSGICFQNRSNIPLAPPPPSRGVLSIDDRTKRENFGPVLEELSDKLESIKTIIESRCVNFNNTDFDTSDMETSDTEFSEELDPVPSLVSESEASAQETEDSTEDSIEILNPLYKKSALYDNNLYIEKTLKSDIVVDCYGEINDNLSKEEDSSEEEYVLPRKTMSSSSYKNLRLSMNNLKKCSERPRN